MGKKKKRPANSDKGRHETTAGGDHSDKRAAVVSAAPRKRKGLFAGLGIVALFVSFVAFSVFSGSGFEAVKAEAGEVRIALSEVDDGKAHFYTFKGRKDVNFFVLKSSDGIIRAAFDACDVCFREKKGYRQEGDIMVCNNCGQRFPSVKINEIRGGCNPAPLDRRTDGEYLLIRDTDIDVGSFYF